jgi:hypothetical protein
MLRFIVRHATYIGDRELAAYSTCDADVPELEAKIARGTRLGEITDGSMLVSVLAVEILKKEEDKV